MHLTLLIPDLLWPEPEDRETLEALPCPALEKLLGRARFQRQPRQALENCLIEHLGSQDSSLAAARLLGENGGATLLGTGSWFCADPIHLQFHHERIILGDASLLDLEAEEIQTLLASLNKEFADLGRFHAPHPQRWYLEAAPGLELPPLPPLSAASGRQLGSLMPESPQLSRLMNELQMLLHTHPVNRARELRGRPIINGLWLWGGETPPSTPQPGHDVVWAGLPLARGLAEHRGVPVQDVPADHADYALRQAHSQGHRHLVVLDNLLAPTLIEDGDAWRTTMTRLENDWFAPLAGALGKALDTLELISPTSYGVLHWQVTPRQRWAFWKTPLSLHDLARKLAEQTG